MMHSAKLRLYISMYTSILVNRSNFVEFIHRDAPHQLHITRNMNTTIVYLSRWMFRTDYHLETSISCRMAPEYVLMALPIHLSAWSMTLMCFAARLDRNRGIHNSIIRCFGHK